VTDIAPVEAAIALLREVVADFRDRGRTTLAAGIKPELQRRSHVGFDEHALGFERFSDFLEYAASQGAIEVTRHRGQPVVQLPGDAADVAVVSSSRERSRRRPRIRPDLWEAFTNWGDWRRAWDKTRTIAIKVAANANHDTPAMREVRQRWEAEPHQFVEIPGIPQEEQLSWMRDFAEAQTGTTGLLLRYALKEEQRKAQAFSQAAREDPAVFNRWMDLRVQKVIDAVEDWKAQTGVDVDIYDHTITEPPVADVTQPPPTVPDSEEELRALAHRAIDGMTVAELLELPIRLGHVFKRA
jgi:hypothetical protein